MMGSTDIGKQREAMIKEHVEKRESSPPFLLYTITSPRTIVLRAFVVYSAAGKGDAREPPYTCIILAFCNKVRFLLLPVICEAFSSEAFSQKRSGAVHAYWSRNIFD